MWNRDVNDVVPRPLAASFSVSWRGKVADAYRRIRASRSLMAVLLIAVTLCWFQTRLHAYTELVQNRREQVMGGFGLLLSAATAPLRFFPWHGDGLAAGQYDKLNDVFRDFRPFQQPTFNASGLVYTEKGLLAAIRLASNYLGAPASAATIVAMQLAFDLLVLYALCFLLWRWGGPLAGICGGLYYAGSAAAAEAATFPFYYYWPIPFGVALCLIADGASRRGEMARLRVSVGLGLCAGLWLFFRATSVLIPASILAAFLAARVPFRRLFLLMPVIVVLQQLPAFLVAVKAPPGEHAGLGRSNIWHSLYIGIGTRPNPYGIEFSDSSAAGMVARRHGIVFEGPGYEAALRQEYLKIVAERPGLIARNAVRNFADAVRGWSFPRHWHSVGRWLWLATLAGLIVTLRRRSDRTFPFVLASSVWVVQCATLGFVCRPQTSYLWETLAIAALAGFGGLGLAFEWTLEKLGWKSLEVERDAANRTVVGAEPGR